MDQQTAVVIVLVALLLVALVLLAGRSGKVHLKFWEVEAGVQADAPKNIITGDQKSVADNNTQRIRGKVGRNKVGLANSTAKNNKQEIEP